MRTEIVLTLLGLAAATGCGAESSSQVAAGGVSSPTTEPSLRADTVLRCGNDEVPLDRLTNPRPATSAESAPKRVLYKFKPGDIGDLGDYWIVDDEPERVSIIREHVRGEGQPSTEVTYDFASWEYVADAPGATTDWMYFGGATSCVLKRAFEGLNDATITLDPSALPQPGDRVVRLLVDERACASGQQATGRVRVPVLELSADKVRVAIGVATQQGGQTCPGHPPTPYVLELPEPLGNRLLIDASAYPEREIQEGQERQARRAGVQS
ncbi:hypothetical protein [Sporichthya polymorpha]|uniref:hypothetical protein n=1 Tax=Sporichthya polymorpha TaxID=35751 RepID=UPI00036B30F3|nr:hypothetical protein [Sporichthya polymorpha]